MTKIKQKDKGCGFACLAMLTNKSLETVEQELGYSESLVIEDGIKYLRQNNFKVYNINNHYLKLPNFGLLIIRKGKDKINNKLHCVILRDYAVINPNEPNKNYCIKTVNKFHDVLSFIKIENGRS